MIKNTFKALKNIKSLKTLAEAKDEIARERAVLMVKNLLSEEGGIFAKFMQYQNTKHANSGKNSVQEITTVSKDEIKSLIKENFSTEISQISDKAIGASIGQVHFAKYNDIDIAIKVQYPNIKNELIKQLELLDVLPKAMNYTPIKKWGIDLRQYQLLLRELLEQECNYQNEKNELDHWHSLATNYPLVVIPKPINELSNEFILTTEKFEGLYIEDYATRASESQKREISNDLVTFYFDLILNHQIMQGDTNHGNFLFSQFPNQVCILDLGQTVKLSPNYTKAISTYLISKEQGTEINGLLFFKSLGFDANKLKPLNKRLNLLIDVLFTPLTRDYAFDLKKWNYKKEIDLILGEDKWWFRSAGGTEFFTFMKSFMGFKELLMKLEINIYFKKVLAPLLRQDNFDESLLALNSIENDSFSEKASHISVKLVENEIEKVNLTFPFIAIFELEEYLGDELVEELKNSGVIITNILSEALSDGGKPKLIFNGEIKNRKATIELIKKEES